VCRPAVGSGNVNHVGAEDHWGVRNAPLPGDVELEPAPQFVCELLEIAVGWLTPIGEQVSANEVV
jgi:hypothetical protein